MTNLEYLRTKYGIQEKDMEPELVNWLMSREKAFEILPLIGEQQIQAALDKEVIQQINKTLKEHAKQVNKS